MHQLGQLVTISVHEEKTAGTYTVYWDGNDRNGQPVSSGIYFYKLHAGDFTEVEKMVLINGSKSLGIQGYLQKRKSPHQKRGDLFSY
jgi:flagellar hook assembly protein FlgD